MEKKERINQAIDQSPEHIKYMMHRIEQNKDEILKQYKQIKVLQTIVKDLVP